MGEGGVRTQWLTEHYSEFDQSGFLVKIELEPCDELPEPPRYAKMRRVSNRMLDVLPDRDGFEAEMVAACLAELDRSMRTEAATLSLPRWR